MADLPITSDDGAMPIVINDPTTTANVANVKAASTAAVVGDNSLVVALSPNSPIPTGTNNIGVTGVAQGSTTSGEHGDLVQGAVTTSAPIYVTGQTSPLSITTVGNLRIDGSSVTQPISGTVTANQGTANTTANKWPIEIVDSGGVNVASVNASNELLVTDTDLTLAQGSTTSGQLGPLIQGAVTTAAPTYVTTQTNPLSLTTTGDLRTVAKTQDGSGNNITSQANGTQRALDIGIDVAGVQIDPRQVVGQTTNGSAANPNPVVIGGRDASGNVDTVTAESILGKLGLWVNSNPVDLTHTVDNKSYALSVDVNLPTSGTETRTVLVTNPNGSGKTLILKKFVVSSTAANNGAAEIRVYVSPTITTNGTTATPVALNVGNSQPASAINAFTSPTIAANGNRIYATTVGQGNVVGGQAEDLDGSVILQSNNSLLITGNPTINNLPVSFNFIWAEI